MTYGSTRDAYLTYNNVYGGNLAAAEDSVINPATGQAACRINDAITSTRRLQSSGRRRRRRRLSVPNRSIRDVGKRRCVEAMSPTSTTHDSATLAETVAGLAVNGNTDKFLHLIGGAPISFAAGYEYRKEEDTETFDSNEALTTGGATGVNMSASQDVSEVYGELEVPLIKDLPFAKLVSVNFADRYAEYSTVKGVNSYDIGGVWAPISDIRFRGTYSVAVRAPNLTEEFSPTCRR